MRVLIDTSYAARGPSGTAVYVQQLIRALRLRREIEVVEAAQPRRFPAGAGNPLRSAANALLDLHWLHRGLAVAASRAGADVVHHPLPAHSRGVRCAQVATFHDLAFEDMPQGYGRVWRALAARTYRTAACAGDALVCVSAHTADEVVGRLSAERSKVVVAPHGPGQVEGIEAPPGRREHLLYVGDAQRRKGVGLLLEAYAAYRDAHPEPAGLVIAGAAAEALVPAPKGVRGVRGPSREQLLALHGSALALVHPSRHEGFGLTVLEALALGTPVIAASNPATEELAAGAALLVTGAAQMAEAMSRVTLDAGLREKLAGAGRASAARFSWDASARAHERAYTLASR